MPLPLPEPDTIVSHDALLAADHEHVAVAVMLAVDVPPFAPADADVGTV